MSPHAASSRMRAQDTDSASRQLWATNDVQPSSEFGNP